MKSPLPAAFCSTDSAIQSAMLRLVDAPAPRALKRCNVFSNTNWCTCVNRFVGETPTVPQHAFKKSHHGLFQHHAHTHSMVTRRERAAEWGIGPGVRVTFECEGRRLMGVVNRITKRATVLVEDPTGRRYSANYLGTYCYETTVPNQVGGPFTTTFSLRCSYRAI